MVLEGLITVKEIDDAKSGKASGRVISVGLPAYCLFQALLRSAKANCTGILIGKYSTTCSVLSCFLRPVINLILLSYNKDHVLSFL